MTVTILSPPEQRWSCPHCVQQEVTHYTGPHTQMHACRGMKLMTIPMIPDGQDCKVELVERGDWVGDEIVQVDGEGRPWMSTVITRTDGQDTAVYASHATTTYNPRSRDGESEN